MDHAAGHTAADLKACIDSSKSDSIQSRVSYTHSEDVKDLGLSLRMALEEPKCNVFTVRMHILGFYIL